MGEKGHLTPDDAAYLRERIRIELLSAKAAPNPQVAAIHAEMAKHYQCVLELGTSPNPRIGG
jgi:hypothetical protein